MARARVALASKFTVAEFYSWSEAARVHHDSMSAMGQRRRSQHVRNESAYPPIAAGEQTSRLVGSVPIPDSCTAANSISIRSPRRRGTGAGLRNRRPASRPGHHGRAPIFHSRSASTAPTRQEFEASGCSKRAEFQCLVVPVPRHSEIRSGNMYSDFL